MLKIGVLKEIFSGEKRAALVPSSVERLVKKQAQVLVESGLGASIYSDDNAYKNAGAAISDRVAILSSCDILLRVRKPPIDEIAQIKKGAIHISFLDPFNEKPLMAELAKHDVSAISLEMIPRIARAQKMDALSSQANLAGYVSVILAAERLSKIFPMLMTSAGTINPAKVFVVGAGVAGLQAIATARRLGARVEAFDTRIVTKEQVKSLGANFVEIDLGETGQTSDGYAKALTPEQLEKQRQAMLRICANSDVIITTAQVFGRKSPTIITREMIEVMKPGSVIIDAAVDGGGNVEDVRFNEEILINGVRVVGLGNLPAHVCIHASQMLSNNIVNLLEEYWDKNTGVFTLDPDDEIMKRCLITHQGKILNEQFKNR